MLMLAALVAGTGVGYVYFGSPTFRQVVHDYRRGMWNVDKAFPNQDELTFMVLGRDVDRDRQARVVKTNGRTDTILLVRIDFRERTANILSIPRDTKVRIPGYRGQHKINAAHAFGGPELTADTIERFLNIRPEEYVVVNYESFSKAIDMLGGLEVTVDKQMDYDDNWGDLHIHLRPGKQLLDGREALGFVRFRKSNDGNSDSDHERIARQQQFLMALRDKTMSSSTFLKLPDIIETVRGGVNSSMSDAQMMALVRFIRSLPAESIRTATLPGTEGRVYVTADEDAARELIDEMFLERPGDRSRNRDRT